ncbi:Rab7a [Symbiodinium pilosum]|uniref:Rab7a protein n=1 Tax=Symbiodinium pilosum TaxID=2952 RepID=A0A812WKW4_SYMPI|nr:Rab7a [Symbiodinium pilosum]
MKSEPAGPAVEDDLPQVAVRLDGNQVITLQRFIQERLHTPALIEVTIEAVLSDRKCRQIKKQCELAKHLGCTPVLFFNGMEDAKIAIDVETLPVWISRENVEHFAFRQAQKKAEKVQAAEARALAAEMALQQLQGSAPAQPTVIWACQLRKDYDFDDGTAIEVAGNAFKLKGAIADAATSAAIKEKKPETVLCDADELDIYSRKDRELRKSEQSKHTHSLTSKPPCCVSA